MVLILVVKGKKPYMKYDLTILLSLMDRPMYGYEFKKVIENVLITCDSAGKGFTSSMIYPSLARFEKEGIISKQIQIQEGKPNRNVYEMTEKGKRFFYSLVNQITPQAVHDRETFYYRLSCFPYLTEKNREKLLSRRQKYLEQAVLFAKTQSNKTSDCRDCLHEFTASLGELELKYIAFFQTHISDPVKMPEEEIRRIDAED